MSTQTYENLIERVYNEGTEKPDRTGTGTLSYHGGQIRYNLKDGFPLVTSKKVYWTGVIEELLWFLRGETSVTPLQNEGVHIWDEWADEHGNLGPVYGKQWRDWRDYSAIGSTTIDPLVNHDQIATVLRSLHSDPFSRRHIVSAWNVADLDLMALAPCHFAFQFLVNEDSRGIRYLSIVVYQRSADMFLGVPFNLASYALLTHMVAWHLGYSVGELIWNGSDCHIYTNHLEQVEQLLRNHQSDPRPLPGLRISIDKIGRVFDDSGNVLISADDVTVEDYDPHPTIKAPVAI